MSEEDARPYDIVVFGSTGYTGKFVAEETHRMQSQDHRSLRWAAAGRSAEKVRACLEGTTTLIIARRYNLRTSTGTPVWIRKISYNLERGRGKAIGRQEFLPPFSSSCCCSSNC